jgi:hypothetical protein
MDFKKKFLKYKNKYIELKNSLNYSKLQNAGKDMLVSYETAHLGKDIPYTFIKDNKSINAKIYTDLYESISHLTDNELNNGTSLTKTFSEFIAKSLTTYTYRYTLSNNMLTTILMIGKRSPDQNDISDISTVNELINARNNVTELINAIESAFAKTTNVVASKQLEITDNKNTDVDGPIYHHYGKEELYFSKKIPYTFIKDNKSINAKIYTDLYESISNLKDNELNNGTSLTKTFSEFTAKNLTTYTYSYTLSNNMLTAIFMIFKQLPNSSIVPSELEDNMVTNRKNIIELFNAIESAFSVAKTTNVDAAKQLDIAHSKI